MAKRRDEKHKTYMYKLSNSINYVFLYIHYMHHIFLSGSINAGLLSTKTFSNFPMCFSELKKTRLNTTEGSPLHTELAELRYWQVSKHCNYYSVSTERLTLSHIQQICNDDFENIVSCIVIKFKFPHTTNLQRQKPEKSP